MSVMELDIGNSIVKVKIVRREMGESAFLYVSKQLTESECKKITNLAGIQNQSDDYLLINRKSYLGEIPEHHWLIAHLTGTARNI